MKLNVDLQHNPKGLWNTKMKILHTSDWHLGQSFFTKSRKDEHQSFINWLLQQVTRYQIDAVIIAGDIFDTGTPPSYAREMYNQFVVDMAQKNCVLVVLGGNHDSVSTLNESKQLLARLNTYVIASTAAGSEQQIIQLKNQDSEVGAILCAIPFIRPRDVIQSEAGQTGLQKQQNLGAAIKAHYSQLYQQAVAVRESNKLNVPIVATGHLTALGVSQSESVRDIYVGTLEGFAADGFPPADYIALGHIHRSQIVAKKNHIRYSGSPIALSFDELGTHKKVLLVEFSQGLKSGEFETTVSPIEVPVFQPMAVIKGDLGQIQQALLDLPSHDSEIPTWLCIEVQIEDYLSDLPQRIQTLSQGLNVEVLQLRRQRNVNRGSLMQIQQETLDELSPIEVFQKRLEMECFDGDDGQELRTRIQQQFQNILSETEDPEAAK
jgi:exonuclease SbcD